ISAEQKEGGVRMNLIPREGGNVLGGMMYLGYAHPSWQGDNLSEELKARGLTAPNTLKRYQDVNPAVGGPIVRDKIWYYLTARSNRIATFAPIYYNKNA